MVCVMLSPLNTNSVRQLDLGERKSSVERWEIMWLNFSSLTGLLSQASADFFQPPLHFFSKWYWFGGARNWCIHGCQDNHPFHPSTHLDANSPWCTLPCCQLYSQPVCTTTERSAATSAPVTVVLVSLDLHDLAFESGFIQVAGIRTGLNKRLICCWRRTTKALWANSTLFSGGGYPSHRKKHFHVGRGNNDVFPSDISINRRSLHPTRLAFWQTTKKSKQPSLNWSHCRHGREDYTGVI